MYLLYNKAFWDDRNVTQLDCSRWWPPATLVMKYLNDVTKDRFLNFLKALINLNVISQMWLGGIILDTTALEYSPYLK